MSMEKCHARRNLRYSFPFKGDPKCKCLLNYKNVSYINENHTIASTARGGARNFPTGG